MDGGKFRSPYYFARMDNDIITAGGIEIVIRLIDDEHLLYTATSEDAEFVEIFGSSELKVEGDGLDLQDYVLANVPQRYQDKAFEIIKEIQSAI